MGNRRVKCKLCKAQLGDYLCNLIRHIKKKHPSTYEKKEVYKKLAGTAKKNDNTEEDEGNSDSDSKTSGSDEDSTFEYVVPLVDEDDKSKDMRRKRSWIHGIATKINAYQMKCNLCSAILSIVNNNLGNMARHIEKKHAYIYARRCKTSQSDTVKHMDAVIQDLKAKVKALYHKDYSGSRTDNLIYKFFDNSLKEYIFKCLLCHMRILSDNDVNLRSHFKRQHSFEIKLLMELMTEEEKLTFTFEEDKLHFKEIDDSQIVCTHCNQVIQIERLEDRNQYLLKHLKEHHPNFYINDEETVLWVIKQYTFEYKMIPTNRGKSLLMFREYTFSQNQQTSNYYCSKKDSGCKAKVKLNKCGRVEYFKDGHTHSPPKYLKMSDGTYVKLDQRL